MESFNLSQNYPNPFNPQTAICYDLPEKNDVKLTIYDVIGRSVYQMHETQNAGRCQVVWHACDQAGSSVPTGIYFYRLEAGVFTQVRKMVLVR